MQVKVVIVKKKKVKKAVIVKRKRSARIVNAAGQCHSKTVSLALHCHENHDLRLISCFPYDHPHCNIIIISD